MEIIDSVYNSNENIRLDVFVAEIADLTRSRAAAIIVNGGVSVNGKKAAKNLKLKTGDKVSVQIPEVESLDVLPENIPIDIVYEDSHLLVVNKPKGMVVHPAAGHSSGTLVNAVLWHCGDSLSGINGVMRPGIVHRIDMNTSGLLMIAKNDNAHQHLAKQISEHSFVREYEAVVYGNIKQDTGIIEAPIGRHPVRRKEMAVTEKNGKPAVTHYSVLER
ncbi:MAG: RluA family pseudouridine synthase, partial [Clostridia bacterium]|nr:RluA family pseudouridine synthase [Clostridia bacterium]